MLDAAEADPLAGANVPSTLALLDAFKVKEIAGISIDRSIDRSVGRSRGVVERTGISSIASQLHTRDVARTDLSRLVTHH